MNSSDQNGGSSAFVRVLRGLLRPLVRTMIARGLTAPVVYSLLKRVYVEVAETHFALDDKPLTDSRIAMLTGVHRKDIRTIRSETDDGAGEARRKSALLATVIGQWMTNPGFLDADGAPRPLSRSEDGFDALVRTVSKDVRPRTVLDELTRAGLVSETADGALALRAEAVVGTGSTADREAFFAANVGDHLAAASENLLAEEPPFFERAVFYNQLTPESVDEIEAAARTQAQALLEQLSAQSSALRRAQDADGAPHQRYRMGVYFYREDADATPETEDKGSDTP
ncbi:MAG: DUF6502 family protein [Pseudomonadota bacterium]